MVLIYSDPTRSTWRTLQLRNHQERLRKRRRRLFWRRVTLLMGLILVAGAIVGAIEHNAFTHLFSAAATIRSDTGKSRPAQLSGPIDKRQLPELLPVTAMVNLDQARFEIVHDGVPLTVQTSLDMDLQRYLLEQLNPAHALYVGIVAMDPSSGRILAMVGHDKNQPAHNPCTETLLPAASIFKIITAAAALESQRVAPESTMTYTGNKYTLYHSQVQEKAPKYANKASLRDCFAQSINPVFGKLGAFALKKDKLSAYANAFGFNRPIDFELGLSPSNVTITDDPYELAEVASGFNRHTSITPVHGAMMAAAVVNKGQMMAPWIIESIGDSQGKSVYQGRRQVLGQAMAAGSTPALKEMMNETIASGTCRKAFKGFRRDPVLSRLNIGGKTGSINTEDGQARVDWFVGFAEQAGTGEKIALGIVVAHEEFIGIRANQYGMMAMKHYFQTIFAKAKNGLPAAAPQSSS